MNAKLIRSYRSKQGNVTFVYGVSGNATQLEAYKEAQGEYYREDKDNGTPLWFTTRCIGDDGILIITSTGKVVPDMSEFDKTASLVEQFGGNFGQSLADQAVAKLLGKKAKPAVKAEDVSVEEEDDNDLDEL